MSAPSPSIGASAAHSCGEESFTDDCAEELAQSLLTMVGSREQPYTLDELLVRAAQLGEEVRRLTAESFERAMTQRGERAALEEAEAQLGNNHAIGRRRTRSGSVASCSERLATAARSAKLWRERARRPIARGQAPRAMDDGQLKKAFLFSVRRGASRSRLRREKSHLDRILRGGALEELTRERAFVREVRRLALIEGPLLPDRPAAAMVRSGDLDCDLVRPDAAARVFRHTGICVFEGPRSCWTSAARALRARRARSIRRSRRAASALSQSPTSSRARTRATRLRSMRSANGGRSVWTSSCMRCRSTAPASRMGGSRSR